MLLGLLLLAVAAGWVPLVARFYSGSQGGPRAVAVVAAAGGLMVLLRPPLPAEVWSPMTPVVGPVSCRRRRARG